MLLAEQNRPVLLSLLGAVPLLSIGLFFAIRQSLAYIIGRPEPGTAQPTEN
jgi:hypothetical protein